MSMGPNNSFFATRTLGRPPEGTWLEVRHLRFTAVFLPDGTGPGDLWVARSADRHQRVYFRSRSEEAVRYFVAAHSPDDPEAKRRTPCPRFW